MRCLWITRQDPRPQDSGELIYSLGLISALSKQPGMDVTVLAHLGKKASSAEHAVNWELHGTIPNSRIPGMISRLPSDAWRLGNPCMRSALSKLLGNNRWDWIVIDQAACAWALEMIPQGQPIAYIAHNHEASLRKQVARSPGGSLPMRLALLHDSSKYAKLESQLCQSAILISAITPRDADQFRQEHPQKEIIVLPPGYERENGPDFPQAITDHTPRRVVLAGAFEWLAKRRNLETFLAAASQPFQEKGIDFLVVGKAAPAYFESLAAKYPWAEFRANVASMAPHFQNARMGLIPEALGGGFKLKALDYIFAGLPLASIQSALSGIPIDPASDCVCADTPESLAYAVAAQIDDTEFLNRAAETAHFKCRDAFDWESRGRSLAKAMQASGSP